VSLAGNSLANLSSRATTGIVSHKAYLTARVGRPVTKAGLVATALESGGRRD
jgi:hypothetical protein